ncbi:hypothetical protein J2T57_001981 [Natronocella acetinitrilica]|uniref:Uncharacterized protein n=1 Tax=Natronocella acetinitrilica TaxID=414046 RepID=A0AAE3G453_9GAMM|nr:hypothetical protein [Natronocella acetinitrilica]MCP1674843.1 hypothetical protein [Natronocella acetinitrilica]
MEQARTATATHEGYEIEKHSPMFGLIPRRKFERFILLWAVANIVLTLTPVFTSIGNSAVMVGSILPMTIFWSYAVFLSNCALGLTYFLVRARPWAIHGYKEN